MIAIDTLEGDRLRVAGPNGAGMVEFVDQRGAVAGRLPVEEVVAADRFLVLPAEKRTLTLGPVAVAQVKRVCGGGRRSGRGVQSGASPRP